jgi:GTPase SAR1 family protein
MLVTLLNHNADRDPVSKEVQDQCTPLHIAAKKGNVTCVKTLVAANCCLNKQNKHGKVPLHFAAMRGHLEIAKCLISAGCKRDACDNLGCTALHFASEEGHIAVAALLTQSSVAVNPTIKNKNSQTAEQLARSAKHKKIASLLREYGKKYEEWSRQVTTTVPISKLKLYVCGDTGVGKSSLLATLQAKLLNFSQRDKTGCENSNGINIQDIALTSGSWFSAWDVGGNMRCNIGIEYLLSAINAIFMVVVSLLSDGNELQQQVHNWLSLIRTCSLSSILTKGSLQSTFRKPSVLLVLSHADVVEDAIQQRGIVAVHEAASVFKNELDVLGDIKVFCVNSTSCDTQMANLKAVINKKYQQIIMSHPQVPLFCEVLGDFVSKSASEKTVAPVLHITDLRSIVTTTINPLITREHLHQALSVLTTAGRVSTVEQMFLV